MSIQVSPSSLKLNQSKGSGLQTVAGLRHMLAARPLQPVSSPPIVPSYRGGRITRQERRSWHGVSGLVLEVSCDGQVHADLKTGCTQLSVLLEEVGGRIEISRRIESSPSSYVGAPRPLSLIPADADAFAHARGVVFLRHLMLQFDDPAALANLLEDEINLERVLIPRLMFSDARLFRLAQLFADECMSSRPMSRLYGDSLSIALILELSRLDGRDDSAAARGGLAGWQIRRVLEYVDAHLADDIQLQTLADLVRLSRFHFCRAFKASTGFSPHKWQLRARIEKAKQFLVQGKLPLSHVAVGLGFADQSHFTHAFQRVVGQSPGAWQNARRAA